MKLYFVDGGTHYDRETNSEYRDVAIVVAESHSKARYLFWNKMRHIDYSYEQDGMIKSGIKVRYLQFDCDGPPQSAARRPPILVVHGRPHRQRSQRHPSVR